MQLFFCQYYKSHKQHYHIAYQQPTPTKGQKTAPKAAKINLGWSSFIFDLAANYDIFRPYTSGLSSLEFYYNIDFDYVMLLMQKQNADFINSLS